MTVRFRIRTSQGQEVSFASHKMFEDFVRAGDLAPDDLVYDGETGEWAPARTHPLVLQVEYEKEDGGSNEVGASDVSTPQNTSRSEEGSRPVRGSDVGDAFGLELMPAAEPPSPEDAAKAFVEKMESERAMEREFGPSATGMSDLRMDTSSVLADMMRAKPPPVERSPAPAASPVRSAPARSRREEHRPASRPAPKRGRMPPPPRKGGGVAKKVALAVVVLGVFAAGAYFGLGLFAGEPESMDPEPVVDATPGPTVDSEPPPPAREPTIASTREAVRERASERFLSSTQALVEDLPSIPEEWLTGPYLRLPSDHMGIRDVWQRYRLLVQQVRGADRGRYRSAYQAALDDAVIMDEADRAERLEAAMAEFGTRLAQIDAHWQRVDELALAAIQSHDALLEAEGLILYDATGATGRPSGIGQGTSGRDSDAQLLLDQVVDLMERSLDAEGLGPREGAAVREWVWSGFLDVAAR